MRVTGQKTFFVRFSVFHTSVTTCTAVFSSHAFVKCLYNLMQLLMEHLIHSCNTNPQLLCFYNYFGYNSFLNDDYHSDPLWCLFSIIISSPCFQKQTSWGVFKDQCGIIFFYLAFCRLKASSNEILLKPFGSRNYTKVSFGLDALNLGKCCHTYHVACGNWYSPHSLCSLFLLAV